jgi:hypothetical protein
MTIGMKEKDLLESARQSPVSDRNWRAFSIVGHLRALFYPAGNVFAISLWRKSRMPHRKHTCDFHLNFRSFEAFEAFESQKADECSLLHLALFSWMPAKIKARHNGVPYRSMS